MNYAKAAQSSMVASDSNEVRAQKMVQPALPRPQSQVQKATPAPSESQHKYDPAAAEFQPKKDSSSKANAQMTDKKGVAVDKYQKLEAEVKTLLASQKSLQQDLEDAKANEKQLHEDHKVLAEADAVLFNENDALKAAKLELEATVTSLRNEKAQIKAELDKISKSLKQAQVSNGEHEEHNAKLQTDLNARNQEAAAGRVLSVGGNGGNVQLQQNISLGHKDMEVVRDHINRSQRIPDQPDEEVKDLYDQLCTSISDFVGVNFRRVKGMTMRLDAMANNHEQGALLKGSLPQHAARAVEAFPKSDGSILKAFLWGLVRLTVFDMDSMLVKLSPQADKILNATFKMMSQLRPLRDPQNTRYWRAEGFRALEKDSCFREGQDVAITEIAALIANIINGLEPGCCNTESIKSTFLDKAIELDWALRTSTRVYYFGRLRLPDGEAWVKEIKKDTFYDMKIVNAGKGAAFDRSQVAKGWEDKVLGRIITKILPELSVEHAGGNGSRTLSVATMLASIHAEADTTNEDE